MPQAVLPIFPSGTTEISQRIAFECRGEQVVYFNGHLPVFTHEVGDQGSFRLFTTQLIVNGSASQGEIVKAFGVSMTTVKRSCRILRERGAAGFFKPPKRKEGHKLTPEVLAQAQELLDGGLSIPKVGSELGVLATTLHKAVDSGRLRILKKKTSVSRLHRKASPRATKASAAAATGRQSSG